MVLKLRVPPPGNWNEAKCKNIPLSRKYDPFFGIEFDIKGNPVDEDEAKSHAIDFCNGDADGVVCPIRDSCLLFALTNNAKEGVWGGTSEITRKAIRRKYPPGRSNKPRKEWQWCSEQDALKGLKRKELLQQDEEE